jgi:hypothetical protein
VAGTWFRCAQYFGVWILFRVQVHLVVVRYFHFLRRFDFVRSVAFDIVKLGYEPIASTHATLWFLRLYAGVNFEDRYADVGRLGAHSLGCKPIVNKGFENCYRVGHSCDCDEFAPRFQSLRPVREAIQSGKAVNLLLGF